MPNAWRGAPPYRPPVDAFQLPLIELVDMPEDTDAALRPLMDLISNAFGHARCFGYGMDGKYRERG